LFFRTKGGFGAGVCRETAERLRRIPLPTFAQEAKRHFRSLWRPKIQSTPLSGWKFHLT
jgi:hypothetical protein